MSKMKVTIEGTDDMDKKIQALKEAVAQMPKKNTSEPFAAFTMGPNKDGVSVTISEEEE